MCMYVLFIDRFQIHDKNIKNIFTLVKENCPESQINSKILCKQFETKSSHLECKPVIQEQFITTHESFTQTSLSLPPTPYPTPHYSQQQHPISPYLIMSSMVPFQHLYHEMYHPSTMKRVNYLGYLKIGRGSVEKKRYRGTCLHTALTCDGLVGKRWDG